VQPSALVWEEEILANPPYGPPGGYQYQPQPGPGGYPPPAGPVYDNDKGFFASLFDFSFDNFVAPKLVKIMYVLSMIFVTLYVILLLIAPITRVALVGGTSGSVTPILLITIIVAPIIWLVMLIITRIFLEMAIVQFKISDDIKDIRDRGPRR
jgi:Domain of unknown function (DUF4282)